MYFQKSIQKNRNNMKSMLIYNILLAVIGIFAAICSIIKNKEAQRKVFIIISCICIIVLQGLRNPIVGNDIQGYLIGYRISTNFDLLHGDKIFNYEVGYSLLNQFLCRVGVSNQLFLGIIAALIIIPIGLIWQKYSQMPLLSIVLYIGFGFFVFSFSGLRQSIAMAICFYSFKYIQRRKFVGFAISILLAMLFHKSAFVFIVAYPLYSMRLDKYMWVIAIAFCLCFILRQQIFETLASLYKQRTIRAEETGAYTMLIAMIIMVILSLLAVKGEQEDKILSATRNYLVVAAFFQIFATTYMTASRMGYYYFIFITLLVPSVIQKQNDRRMRALMGSVVVILSVIFFQVQTSGGYLHVAPYVPYWE